MANPGIGNLGFYGLRLPFTRVLFYAGFLCAAAGGGLSVSFASAQELSEAELISLSGDVKVLLSGVDEYAAAEEGMLLKAGDSIKTGADGNAELSFNEDNSNLVRLSEESDAVVLLDEDEKIELIVGEVFAAIASLPPGSSFEVRTPTAVSGARGTDWVTKVSEDGTEVEAIDSSPYVKHFEAEGAISGEETLIPAGQMTKVRKHARPEPPQPMRQERRQKWQEMKPLLREHGQKAAMNRNQRPRFDRSDFLKRSKEKKDGSGIKKLDSQKPGEKSFAEKSMDEPRMGRSFDSADPSKKAEGSSSKSGPGEGMPGEDRDKGYKRDFEDKQGYKEKDGFGSFGNKDEDGRGRPSLDSDKRGKGDFDRVDRDRPAGRFENKGQSGSEKEKSSLGAQGRKEGGAPGQKGSSQSQKGGSPGAKGGAGKPRGASKGQGHHR